MNEPKTQANAHDVVYLRLTRTELDLVITGLERYANDITNVLLFDTEESSAVLVTALRDRVLALTECFKQKKTVETDTQLAMPFVVAGADFSKGEDQTIHTVYQQMKAGPVAITEYIDMRDKPLSLLFKEYDDLSERIINNDGRLSSGSSAQLDYEMDLQEDIAEEFHRRFGLNKAVRAIIQKERVQERMSVQHNWLIRALLRIGIVSKNQEGLIMWPFHVYDEMYSDVVLSRQSWFEVIKTYNGARWLLNRWLPFRWGFRFGSVVFGDIGNSHNGIDKLRLSWFKRKPVSALAAEEVKRVPHEWDVSGEKCVKCGDKDMYADASCSVSGK